MRYKSLFQNEAEFIAGVNRRNPRRVAGLTLGIGDDAALVTTARNQEMILTTDMSIEGVHFTSNLHSPQCVGHRALARSLSDIAAMGGKPRYALISFAVSRSTRRKWVDGFFDGFFAVARRFGVAVIGGDTAVTDGPSAVDVVAVGDVARGRAVRRSGAKPGDRVFVSGLLGMSALGLRLLRSRIRPQNAIQKAALRAHCFPQPQCALGQFVRERRLATAMMDLSDGLSIDLRRLCDASDVGAILSANQVPRPSLPDANDALNLALNGGEDYQLLFTVAASKVSRIPRRLGKLPLTCIGEICAEPTIQIRDVEGRTRPLEPGGYDHFARLSAARLRRHTI